MIENNDLSDLEKVVLYYFVFAGFDDWRKLYLLSHETKSSGANLNTLVSRWKNSYRIQKYIETIKAEKDKQKERYIKEWIETEKAKEEGNSGKPGNVAGFNLDIDFTDRNQFIQYLNTQINLLDDDKQKTDYLKMLSDLLRYKDSDSTKDNNIQRFYVPVSCANCAIYKAAQDKQTD